MASGEDEVDHISAWKMKSCRIVTNGKLEWKPGGHKVEVVDSDTGGMHGWKITDTKANQSYFVFGHKENRKWKFATADPERGVFFKEGVHPNDFKMDGKPPKYPHVFCFKNKRQSGHRGDQGVLHPILHPKLVVSLSGKHLKLKPIGRDDMTWTIEER